MKKTLLLALALLSALTLSAQKEDTNPKHDAHYMRGNVPVVNGVVTFSDTIAAPGKTQSDIYLALNAYVKTLVDQGREGLRTRLVSEEPATFTTVAKVEEILTFSKKFLAWDHTYMRYLVRAEAPAEGVGILTITQMSYNYQFDENGENGQIYRAEEWITDDVAVNKKNTKLYPRSGKFRRHTIDRMLEIFAQAKEAVTKP